MNNKKLLQQIIREVLDEMALPEMARTAGTGGAYTITADGEDILRQVKSTGNIPPGLNASKLAILVWLFKSKSEGKRVQKMDYAREKGVLQPAVNPLFNDLEMKGLVSKEGYTAIGPKSGGTARPRPDISSMLDDLDI